jgi:hypothetical protein
MMKAESANSSAFFLLISVGIKYFASVVLSATGNATAIYARLEA